MRSTPRTDSALASFLIEEPCCGAGGRHPTKGWIEIGTVGQSDSSPPLPDDLEQRGVGQGDARTRLAQLSDHFAAVGYEDLLPVPYHAEILAETVLQFTNSNNLHDINVAT